MKKMLRLLGIMALMAMVMGTVLVGCKEEEEESFPSKTETKTFADFDIGEEEAAFITKEAVKIKDASVAELTIDTAKKTFTVKSLKAGTTVIQFTMDGKEWIDVCDVKVGADGKITLTVKDVVDDKNPNGGDGNGDGNTPSEGGDENPAGGDDNGATAKEISATATWKKSDGKFEVDSADVEVECGGDKGTAQSDGYRMGGNGSYVKATIKGLKKGQTVKFIVTATNQNTDVVNKVKATAENASEVVFDGSSDIPVKVDSSTTVPTDVKGSCTVSADGDVVLTFQRTEGKSMDYNKFVFEVK